MKSKELDDRCSVEKYGIVIKDMSWEKNKIVKIVKGYLNNRNARVLLYSLLGSVGVFCWLSLFGNNFVFSSAVGPLVFLGLLAIWQKQEEGRLEKWETLFSVIISIALVCGAQLHSRNYLSLGLRTCLALCFLPCAVMAVICMAKKIMQIVLEQKPFKLIKKWKKVIFVCVFLVNFLIFIFLFPGFYTYDMAAWNEQFSSGILSAHWSITYNLLLALFLDLGGRLFGSYTVGFGIAMLLQMLFVSYVYCKIIIFVAKKTKNKIAIILSVLFFIANPIIVVMSMTDAQDVCFGCLFALLVMQFYEAFKNPNYFNKKTNFLKILITGILLVTIRNNGVYSLLFTLPFVLLLRVKNNKKQIIAAICIVLGFNFVYTGPFLDFIGAQKGTSINEMLGVPSQQLAKAYYENESSFSEGEKEELSKFYDLQGDFSLYQNYPLIADYTKKSLNSEYTKENLLDYVKLYLKIGAKNPKKYVEAFLLNSYGFWMPAKDYDDDRINLSYMNYPGFSMTAAFMDPSRKNMKPVERVKSSIVSRIIDNLLFGNGWYKLPIISLLCSMGWYWMMLVYCFILSAKKKDCANMATLLPVVGLFLTLLLAPVAIYRYMYPIAILLPVFFALICIVLKQKRNNA